MELNQSNFRIKNISNFKKPEDENDKDKIQNDSESIFDVLKNDSSFDIEYLSEKEISEVSSVLDGSKNDVEARIRSDLDKTISGFSSCADTVSKIEDYQKVFGRNFFNDVILTYGNDGVEVFEDIIKKLDDPEALTKKTPLASAVSGLLSKCIHQHSISSRYFVEKFIDNCSIESLTASIKKRPLDKIADYYVPNSSLAKKLTEKYLDIRGKLNDGKIEYSSQGYIGDCWLLSGINAMSYSPMGQEILNNAVSETENGYNVRFEGIDKDIEVTKKELVEAIRSKTYSTGDPDVLLFELAFEKGLAETEKEADSKGEEKDGQDDSHASIDGGNMTLFISALTGKKTQEVTNNKGYNNESYNRQDPVSKFARKFLQKLTEPLEYVLDLKPALDKIENSDNIIASVSFMSKDNAEERYITDTDGKKHRVAGANKDSRHGCAIKSIDGDLVTIINPWNSKEDIVVTKKELLNNAYMISYCDLSKE